MADTQHFQVFIIGAGQAGIPLAHALVKAGKRVALAERKHLGGSCVNFGCTPTKTAVASARIAHLARRASDYGIHVAGVDIDFPAVLARAKSIVADSVTHLEASFSNSDNPKLLRSHAKLVGREGDKFRIAFEGGEATADIVVLNTGNRSVVPPIEGLNAIDYIDAENWLEKPHLPSHLLMIGGGYIGLEMSQFYARLGSKVTVVQGAEQIVAHEDEDVARALQALLEQEGVEFRLNCKAQKLEHRKTALRATLDSQGRSESIDVSHIFLAVGRRPNTDDLGLDTVGAKLSNRGIVEVNERLATNIPGLYAAGDIRGGPMFTHTSWDDFRILESQLIGDGKRTTERVVPYAVFTDPELGRVGMTEREARADGRAIEVKRFQMKHNGKAKELGETAGFIKVIADKQSEQMLGAAVLAVEGGELVHMYVDLINAKASYKVLRNAVHIHPTLAEAVQSAVS